MPSVLAPLCLLVMALVLPAGAQSYRQITAKELHQNASRHVKQHIELNVSTRGFASAFDAAVAQ